MYEQEDRNFLLGKSIPIVVLILFPVITKMIQKMRVKLFKPVQRENFQTFFH